MNDQFKPVPPQPNGEGAPGQETAPGVNVLNQYIKDLSFENPDSTKFLRGPIKNPSLQINFNIEVEAIGQDAFEVTLSLDAEATSETGILYKIELVYAGAFMLRNMPEQAVQPVLYIDCPSLLFPFARRIVADLTREAGYPPLALDPIDFGAFFRQKMAEAQKAQN